MYEVVKSELVIFRTGSCSGALVSLRWTDECVRPHTFLTRAFVIGLR